MKRIAILALVFVLAACAVAPSDADRVLAGAGITNITYTGPQLFFACSEDDNFSQGFTGTGPTGLPVSGVVCAGLFKNYTIRYN